MIRVAVDAMGGDRGSDEIVAGAVDAASDTLQPVIVGPELHAQLVAAQRVVVLELEVGLVQLPEVVGVLVVVEDLLAV